jgi:hypothetical protein
MCWMKLLQEMIKTLNLIITIKQVLFNVDYGSQRFGAIFICYSLNLKMENNGNIFLFKLPKNNNNFI